MKRLLHFFTAAFIVAMMVNVTSADDVRRMDREELKAMLGSPDLILVDVRKTGDWNSSGLKIKGAVREEPDQVATWMNRYPKDKTLVFYCA